jgi:hypothetical protein
MAIGWTVGALYLLAQIGALISILATFPETMRMANTNSMKIGTPEFFNLFTLDQLSLGLRGQF